MRMKKYFIAVLCMTMLLSSIGCSQNKNTTKEQLEDAIENIEDELNEVAKEKMEDSKTESDEKEDEKTNENFVTADEFSLKDGFVEKITKKSSVPDGYIGISSYEEFNLIRNNPSASYILMEDIVCDGSYETMEEFTGVLDGNGYCIKRVSTPLIKELGGKVENMGIELSINIVQEENSSDNAYGGLACKAINSEGAVIENCYSSGSIQIEGDRITVVGGLIGCPYMAGIEIVIKNCCNTADISVKIGRVISNYIDVSVGGVVGQMLWTSDNQCYNVINQGNISVSCIQSNNTWLYIGGICGSGSGGTIQYCCNKGMVNATLGTGRICCAGIIGLVDGDMVSTVISECRNTGNIEMNSNYEGDFLEDLRNNTVTHTISYGGPDSEDAPGHCGGIIGCIVSKGAIINCGNEGEVKGNFNVGGLIATCSNIEKIENCYNTGIVEGKAYTGGIFGVWTKQGTIQYCYNTGEIQGDVKFGSIGGKMNSQSEINYCYYLENDSLHAFSEEALYTTVKALTKKEMQSKKSWEGFDFENTWELKKGAESPVLK